MPELSTLHVLQDGTCTIVSINSPLVENVKELQELQGSSLLPPITHLTAAAFVHASVTLTPPENEELCNILD